MKKKKQEPPKEEENLPPPDLPQPDIQKPVTTQADLPKPDINIPLSISGLPYIGDFLKSATPKLIAPLYSCCRDKPGSDIEDQTILPTEGTAFRCRRCRNR